MLRDLTAPGAWSSEIVEAAGGRAPAGREVGRDVGVEEIIRHRDVAVVPVEADVPAA